MNKFLNDISILKGVGILLVVFGHIQHDALNSECLKELHDIIYSFHMPLFFITSGFLYSYQGYNQISYKTLLKKTAPKFLIPFFSFSIFVAFYKFIIQYILGVTSVTYQVSLSAFLAHFLNPQLGSFALYLWFLYTLFLIQLVYPLIKKNIRFDFIILIICLTMLIFEWPQYFCLNLVVKHLPFFILGVISFEYNPGRIFTKTSFKWLLSMMLLFSAYVFIYLYFRKSDFSYFFMGTFMTFFLWSAVGPLQNYNLLKFLVYIGSISLDIYLWHPLLSGSTKFFINMLTINVFIKISLILLITILLSVAVNIVIKKNKQIEFILYGR